MSTATLYIDAILINTIYFDSDLEMLAWLDKRWTQQRLIWTDRCHSFLVVNEHTDEPHFFLIEESDSMPIHKCIDLLKDFNARAFEGRTAEEEEIERKLEREFELISERDSFLETMIAYDRL